MPAPQRHAEHAPSAKTIARVTADYLSQDARCIGEPFQFRGWTVRRYVSPGRDDVMLVCADRMKADGKPEARSQEATNDDEARAWVKTLPAGDSP